MSSHIDYYFTCPSPFAYMGHKQFHEIAKKHGKTIEYKPFDILGVWGESGAVPPAQRPVVRQRYREIELQRVSEYRNVCVNPRPAYFPTNPRLADQAVCALVIMGKDPASFALAAGRAVWEKDLQIADETVLVDLLEECGHDSKDVLGVATSDEAGDMRLANTQSAIEHDAVGAPAYVYKSEVFWGQDRLDYLDHMIATDRRAFTSDI